MTKKLIKKKRISQNQSVNQVVNIVINDVVKKKKRKKIKKKQASPKPDILGRTQPYQIPLYMPAFPQRIHTQTTSDQTKVSNLLRNYMAVNNAEIKRLKGDLGAYRIQEQSGKTIAYPKNKVSIESVEDDDFTDEIEDDMNQSAEIEYQDGIRLAPTLSEYTESEVDNRPDSPSDSPSDTEVEIRPDSPSDSPNDTEDDWREKLAMRPSSPIPTPPQSDDGYKTAVSESPQAEVSLPPRRGTRKNKNMAELRRELESLGVYARSNTPRAGLVELAEENSISILR